MESGEKEQRLAFEEITRRNVQTTVDYSTETRKIVRNLEKKIELLEGTIRQYDEQFDLIRIQLSQIQTKVYSGGT